MRNLGVPRTAVFSAHAEVVPAQLYGLTPAAGILRARGGSSGALGQGSRLWLYSPRTRR